MVLVGLAGASSVVEGAAASPARTAHNNVYRVPSGAMEPTLEPGARVIVAPGRPAVGEIVVFHPPEEAEHEVCGPTPHVVTIGGQACTSPIPKEGRVKYIKRIVAGPGDEIYIKEGHVYRKSAGGGAFVREHDSYIKPCGGRGECDFPTPIEIPSGHWYLLGDNRGESDDSRFFGAVPTLWILDVARACAPRRGAQRIGGVGACRLHAAHR